VLLRSTGDLTKAAGVLKKRDFKPDYTIETLKELPSIVKEKIESID